MSTTSWIQEAVNKFFDGRKYPSQSDCDRAALAIAGGTTIRMVDIPGSLSYTVVCTMRKESNTHAQGGSGGDEIIVSFREPDSGLNGDLVDLARAVHGPLVPQVTYHASMEGSEPPLGIYTMPLLPGDACIKALRFDVDLSPEEEAKHVVFVIHLARYSTHPLGRLCCHFYCFANAHRYFARCWSAAQPVDEQLLARQKADISSRLAVLKEALSCAVSASTLDELEKALPDLYSPEYPQVLTHGDLSVTNILIDPVTGAITGLVDWSLAAVEPFGMELHYLLMMTGFMDMDGWHYFACRSRLVNAFWGELWSILKLDEDEHNMVKRQRIRALAETATKLGALRCYAFQRTNNGQPSEQLTDSEGMLGYLKAWLED